MHLKPIAEQVVVLFGASSGIGRETALRFAAQGAKVVVAARGAAGLQSLVDEIRRAGGEATAISADTAVFDEVKAVADRAVEVYGGLDTWVHLAAVAVYATFDETTPEEFKRIIEVNLIGQAYGAMAALPHLKRAGGALIHVSSVEARRALPYHSAYAASKHGINGFVETLRLELQHAGLPISVTEILPASINTPFFDNARTKLGVKPKGLPPIYQPVIVADAILHAAQHEAREIIVGGAGKALLMTQRMSPELLDAALLRGGFNGQRTDEPKSADAPDNLFAPIRGHDQVEGSFSDQAFAHSYSNWLDTHPAMRQAIIGMAMGAAATTLVVRAMRGGR